MTTILGLDTALGACSVAVVDCSSDGDVVRARAFELRARGHAEALAPMIAAVMAEAGIAFADLDRLAVTVGPGSFTGLRVGIATARGLALAAGLPTVGMTTLEAIAANVPPEELDRCDGRVAVVLDARRNELYFEIFGSGIADLGGPRLVTVEEAMVLVPASGAVAVGSGAALLAARVPGLAVSKASGQPDAAVFAALAAARPVDSAPPEPLYLRAPDAKLPQRLGVARQQ
jgi:tRNA threonylcarbamoyladenosine biosynthesis protein TsaB